MRIACFRSVLLAPCALALLGSVAVEAQESAPQTGAEDRVRVFLDCQAPYCDFDFFRTEITFVDYVRDRRDSDVHLLVTAQQTGGGGWEFTLSFLGQGELRGQDQTLSHISKGTAVADEVRRGLAQFIKLGLVRYVAATPVAERIQVSVTTPPSGGTPAVTRANDPWNLWSFRVGASGSLSGEQTSESARLSGSVSANRTTDLWKIETTGSGSYNESAFEYELSDGTLYSSSNYQHSYNGNLLIVRSVGGRWASGGQLTVSGNTRTNQRLTVRLAPAVEANYFPYSQSTHRQLTARYTVGLTSYSYRDTTIYLKTSDVIPEHSLQVGFAATRPWGNVSLSILGSQALNDTDKYRLTGGGGAEFRLFRGFSLNVFGNYSRINDQVFLAKGEASLEEVLLRQRQLATSYQYFGSLGISYRFGSIFQNVVNPRFDEVFFFCC